MNILPYTVRIMRKDSTVINRLPSSVTAQSGMESQKLTALILSTISDGRAAPLVRPPAAVTVEIVPCATEKNCHHEIEPVSHRCLSKHEADEKSDGSFRTFQLCEVPLENTKQIPSYPKVQGYA